MDAQGNLNGTTEIREHTTTVRSSNLLRPALKPHSIALVGVGPAAFPYVGLGMDAQGNLSGRNAIGRGSRRDDDFQYTP